MLKRLYGDVTEDHIADFLFIKGAFGCTTNGEALEKMIQKLTPILKKEVASPQGVQLPKNR